jgi:hypothetical protein
MKQRKKRPRGSGEEVGILKGRIRGLEKLVDNQKRYIKSLEKKAKRVVVHEEQATYTPEIPEVEEVIVDDKANSCPECGSPEYISCTIWTPKGDCTWIVCQVCKYKEKMSSEK